MGAAHCERRRPGSSRTFPGARPSESPTLSAGAAHEFCGLSRVRDAPRASTKLGCWCLGAPPSAAPPTRLALLLRARCRVSRRCPTRARSGRQAVLCVEAARVPAYPRSPASFHSRHQCNASSGTRLRVRTVGSSALPSPTSHPQSGHSPEHFLPEHFLPLDLPVWERPGGWARVGVR